MRPSLNSPEAALAARAPNVDASGERTVRVLVVEDDCDYAALIAAALSRSETRFAVDTVDRLDSAIQRLEQGSYDVVLLDLTLPDGVGAFTIGRARALSRRLPVIVLTATEDDTLALVAGRIGAQEFLVKDQTDPGSLPTAIAAAIVRHKRVGRLIKGEDRARAHALSGRASLPAGEAEPITGLEGELAFCDHLTRAITSAGRLREVLAVAIVRIDHLEVFRDLGGDRAADEVVQNAAYRLGGWMRGSDTIALIGEDCFGLVLEHPERRAGLARTAHGIGDALSHVRVCDRHGASLGVTASIGLALYPDDGFDLETLVENAEAAEREAERLGGDRYHFYSRPT